ncbi:unnamed protein product [Linum trigynum]|uniref:Uncharacterized protein n=1 Tax=Linum trigynum TaxID=586398 RepID=A0AAV2FXC1_9ROSI
MTTREDSGSGGKTVVIDVDVISLTSPLYLHPSENPGQLFGSDLLTDSNYSEWVNDMTETLIAKNKLVFVDGSFPRSKAGPGIKDDAWGRCDATVKGWLKTAMSKEVRNSVRAARTARDIWADLQQRFGKGSATRAYELRMSIGSLRQEKLFVSVFYTKLITYRDELHSVSLTPRCSCGCCSCDIGRQVREKEETERLFDFLLGLDDAFAVIHSQILSVKPTPSLAEAYQMVVAEEQQKHITGGRRPQVEAAAFQSRQEREGEDEKPRCSHCNKLGHSREACFKLIGYPGDQGKGRQGERGAVQRRNKGEGKQTQPRAANVEVDDNPIPGLSAAQFAQLKQMLTPPPVPTPDPTAHMADKSPELFEWLVDSGCNEHIVRDASWLSEVDTAGTYPPVRIPDGTSIPVQGIGSVVLNKHLRLERVLHVPSFKCNLLSVSRLTKENRVILTFMGDFCMIQDSRSKTMIGLGQAREGLYYLQRTEGLGKLDEKSFAVFAAAASKTSLALWHARLGHPSVAKLHTLRTSLFLSDFSFKAQDCDSYLRAKLTREPFLSHPIKTRSCFDVVHMDIWGGYRTPALDGSRYFLTVVDDFSRATWVYLLKFKSDVERYVRLFCQMVRTQFAGQVRCIQADNGMEFQCGSLLDYYEQHGIRFQTSCVNTPQQNGVVERKHRHLLETARALRFHSGLPVRFWGECVLTATYLINRLPSSVVGNRTPYEVLLGRPPTYHHLRNFGCLVYTKDTGHGLDKFVERGRRGVFIGYPTSQKGYRVYDFRSRRIITSRDCHFVEDSLPYKASMDDNGGDGIPRSVDMCPNQHLTEHVDDDDALHGMHATDVHDGLPSKEHGEEQQGSEADDEQVMEEQNVHEKGRGLCVRRPTRHLVDIYDTEFAGQARDNSEVQYPMSNQVSYHRFSPEHKDYLAAISKAEEPKSFMEAMRDPRWRESTRKEIEALVANGTWDLAFLPLGKKAIEAKWVFKVKYKPDGTVEHFKARLVAKGFTQLEGIDFHDTFAPVAKIVTVRVLIAVTVNRGWPLHQLDVNNAFLHGDLEEEVYMKLPPGFGEPGDTRVCRLKKSLYGLRQASRNWYQKFILALAELGFKPSKADHSLLIYKHDNIFVAALIYVDDVILTGTDQAFITQVKTYLDKKFSIKDLGNLKYFLGIEVARSTDGVVLSQRKYTLDILRDTGVTASRPSRFPMEQNHTLTKPTEEVVDDVGSYRRLVGRRLYLTVTRPDISYAVNILSQFVNRPSPEHVAAAMRVLHYLEKSPGQGLFFPAGGHLDLTAYCDADWAGCQATRRSTTGYYVQLGGAPISWRTKKQKVVSRSSAEAEYRAMASTVSEVLWLRFLLAELGAPQTGPTILHCDNQAALHIAANPIFHERTKHVEMDCYFVRERVASREIESTKISTSSQLADIFTKALGTEQFEFLLSKLGIRDLHASA